MKKNSKKDNGLIKKKRLILEAKKAGITRINKEALTELEKRLCNLLVEKLTALKENITAKGRKTLLKEDVEMVFQKEKEVWEI
jgi:histone H3/H4